MLEMAGAANALAGTVGLETVGALNAAADRVAVMGNTVDDMAFSTMPRTIGTGLAVTRGRLMLNYKTATDAVRGLSFTRLVTATAGVASVDATLRRLGLYQEAADGNLTLVAATAHEAGLLGVTYTLNNFALTTAGGLPASYSPIPGQRYAFGIIIVGGTVDPQMMGVSVTGATLTFPPRLSGADSALTDLPASLANAEIESSSVGWRFWEAMLP